MTIIKAKRVGEKKQSVVSPQQSRKNNQLAIGKRHLAILRKKCKQPNHNLSTFTLPKPRLMHFRELKGKTIEDVVFSTAPGHQDITIKLDDKTGLNFSITADLIFETEYSDWTSGEQRILRRQLLRSTS